MADDDAPAQEPAGRVPGRQPEPSSNRPPPPSTPPAGRGRPITVEITPRQLRLVPGQTSIATVNIRYHGAVVDELTITVNGDAAPWTRVAPESINVYPDTAASATIQFTPPRAPRPLAGLIALELQVASASDPAASVTQQASIEIEPFDELSVGAEGSTSLFGATEAVLPIKVRNLGNRFAEVALAVSPTPAASVFLSTASMTIEPGGEATVWATVRPSPQQPGAPARLHPFSVVVSSRNSPPLTIDARMEQPAVPPVVVAKRRGPPIALLALLGAGLVGVVVAGVIVLNGLGGGPTTPPVGTTPSATAGTGPTGSAQQSPTAEVPTATTEVPTATTEPVATTPPPTPFALVDNVAPLFWKLRSDEVVSDLFKEAGLDESLDGRFAFDPQTMRASWAFAQPGGTSYIRCAGSVDPSTLTIAMDEARFSGWQAAGELEAATLSLCGYNLTDDSYESFTIDASFVTGGSQDVLLTINDQHHIEMDWEPEGPSIPGYSVCAIELAVCFYGGFADVAFGAQGHYFTQFGVEAGSCNEFVFGNPLPNVTKACYYLLNP